MKNLILQGKYDIIVATMTIFLLFAVNINFSYHFHQMLVIVFQIIFSSLFQKVFVFTHQRNLDAVLYPCFKVDTSDYENNRRVYVATKEILLNCLKPLCIKDL